MSLSLEQQVGMIALRGWAAQQSAADNMWTCIAAGQNKFVSLAVSGTGTRAQWSENGQIWQLGTGIPDSDWQDVVYLVGRDRWVGVASGGAGDRVAISLDGKQWSGRAAASQDQWQSVDYSPELDIVVSVGNTPGVACGQWSDDGGETWNACTGLPASGFRKIKWVPWLSKWVAVAGTGSGDRVAVSTDGKAFSGRSAAAQLEWRGLDHSPEHGLLVAAGHTGTGNRVMTSTDGDNWTIGVTPKDCDFIGVKWIKEWGLWCMMAQMPSGDPDKCVISPDGFDWRLIRCANGNQWRQLAWSEDLAMLATTSINGTGNRVMTTR